MTSFNGLVGRFISLLDKSDSSTLREGSISLYEDPWHAIHCFDRETKNPLKAAIGWTLASLSISISETSLNVIKRTINYSSKMSPELQILAKEVKEFIESHLGLLPPAKKTRSPSPVEEDGELLKKIAYLENWSAGIPSNTEVETLELSPTMEITDPLSIDALFDVIEMKKFKFNSLNLSNIIFSDDALKQLIHHLNQRKFLLTALGPFTATTQQIELLLSTLLMTDLKDLDLSRQAEQKTSLQEKERFCQILSTHAGKLSRLRTVILFDWQLPLKALDQLNVTVQMETHFQPLSYNVSLLKSDETTIDEWLKKDSYLSLFESIPPKIIDSPHSMTTLCKALKRSGADRIHFRGMMFTQRAWDAFIAECPDSLEKLILSRCHLEPTMISQIQHLKHLKLVHIGSNGEMANREAFCNALGAILQNQALKLLQLMNNLLIDSDLDRLLKMKVNLYKIEICFYSRDHFSIEKARQFRKSAQPPSPSTESDDSIESISPFRELVETYFTLQHVDKDGHCLFSACRIGTPYTVQGLREAVAAHMEAHRDFFKAFMEENEDIDTYVAAIRNIRWGGNQELVALSRLLNRTIVVYDPNFKTEEKEGKLFPHESCLFIPEGKKGDIFEGPDTIFLLREESHYSKLNPKSVPT